MKQAGEFTCRNISRFGLGDVLMIMVLIFLLTIVIGDDVSDGVVMILLTLS